MNGRKPREIGWADKCNSTSMGARSAAAIICRAAMLIAAVAVGSLMRLAGSGPTTA
jgi:hypothetical protein